MVGIRVSPALRERVEAWAQEQPDQPTLSEAMRRLVIEGLGKRKPTRTTDAARRAASIAAEKLATDHMDKALKGQTDSVKALRKKQLTSMPGGFKRR